MAVSAVQPSENAEQRRETLTGRKIHIWMDVDPLLNGPGYSLIGLAFTACMSASVNSSGDRVVDMERDDNRQ